MKNSTLLSENEDKEKGCLSFLPKVSFADVLKSEQGQHFAQSIAQNTLAEHNKEELEKKKRENNIIIFKMPESGGESRNNDRKFVEDLCSDALSLGLGKGQDNTKIRPVKVVFENSFDKRKFMSKLYLLKDSEQKFKNVSISHDLTEVERETVKSLLKEAEDKTQQELTKNYIWKVRGAPGNMKLVRFKKRETVG